MSISEKKEVILYKKHYPEFSSCDNEDVLNFIRYDKNIEKEWQVEKQNK